MLYSDINNVTATALELLFTPSAHNYRCSMFKTRIAEQLHMKFFSPYTSKEDILLTAIRPITGVIIGLIDVLKCLLVTTFQFITLALYPFFSNKKHYKELATELGFSLALTLATAVVSCLSPIINSIACFTRLHADNSFEAQRENYQPQ